MRNIYIEYSKSSIIKFNEISLYIIWQIFIQSWIYFTIFIFEYKVSLWIDCSNTSSKPCQLIFHAIT